MQCSQLHKFFRIYTKELQSIPITENRTTSTESACAQTKNMEKDFSSSSASSKASSSESTASSVNCVTVSDSDVSVKED